MIQVLRTLFKRDLQKLKMELELYKQEENIWKVDKNIANSTGNLCLHLIGNLNFFIGTTLGKTGYLRNREAEFSLKNISRSELIQKTEDTVLVVDNVLINLTNEQWIAEYPILVLAEKTSTQFFLMHLATHLTYHLGQINYHRRLLD